MEKSPIQGQIWPQARGQTVKQASKQTESVIPHGRYCWRTPHFRLRPILEGRGEEICGVFGAFRPANNRKKGLRALEGGGQGSG